MPDTQTATVKCFFPDKGYGFAVCDSGPDAFIYRSVVAAAGLHDLRRGDRVKLETRTRRADCAQ
jgi:cold shock CspA family protein